MILVIVGGFTNAQAMPLIRMHLGTIAPRPAEPPKSIAWERAGKDTMVRWDSKVRAVCLAFPPPASLKDQLILSLWGEVVAMRLNRESGLRAASDCVFATNHLWNVGPLPFFIYATAKPGVPTSQLRKLMTDRAYPAAAGKPTEFEAVQIGLLAQQVAREPDLNWKSIKQQAGSQAKQIGMDPKTAVSMQLMQAALNVGFRELLMGPDPARAVMEAQRIKASDLNRLIRLYLGPTKRIITTLEPLR
jgi:hypothetical protein